MAVHYPVDNIPVHCGWVSGLESELMERHLKTFHGWEPGEHGVVTGAGMDLVHRNLHAGGTLPGAEDEPGEDWFDAEGYSTAEPAEPVSAGPVWTSIPTGVIRHKPTTWLHIEKRVQMGTVLWSLERIDKQAKVSIAALLGSEPCPRDLSIDVEWEHETEQYVMLISCTLERSALAPEPAAAELLSEADVRKSLSL